MLGPRAGARFGQRRWRALLDAAKRDLPGLRILENQQLRAFALALLLAGCGAGWRTTPLAPGPLPPRQQAQVWTQGHALRWHALVIATDSISGMPFTRAPACDSGGGSAPRGGRLRPTRQPGRGLLGHELEAVSPEESKRHFEAEQRERVGS